MKRRIFRIGAVAVALTIAGTVCLISPHTWLLAWQVRFGNTETVRVAIDDAYRNRKHQPIAWWALKPAIEHSDAIVRFSALAIQHELVPSDPFVRTAFSAGMLASNVEDRATAMHPPQGLFENDTIVPYLAGIVLFSTNQCEQIGAVVELGELAKTDNHIQQVLVQISQCSTNATVKGLVGRYLRQ